ncbi:hypothetical protein DL95DRAFT_454098 [Leptodontidium sp. 2 PMI_412]|nr:hypothetical protein DL95DRAFT_454098 [Leptodontidium sp. 2 PMI_412]
MMATPYSPPKENTITTSFTTVHKNKNYKFPFTCPFKPSSNLVKIDEDEALPSVGPKAPKSKLPVLCNFPLDCQPGLEFAEFIAAFPAYEATVDDVREWLKMWFKACPTLTNDVYLPKFLDRVCTNGAFLHMFKSYNYFELMFHQFNMDLGNGDCKFYPEGILLELVQHAWFAKVKAGAWA